MRNQKRELISIKYQLNTFDEVLKHIIDTSDSVINLDKCQINVVFDLRQILTELIKTSSFCSKITIRNDINEFGNKVFYCELKTLLRCETTIFAKGAFFELVEFECPVIFLGAVFNAEYSFKKSIFLSSVTFSFSDFEVKKLPLTIIPFYRTIFKKDVSFFEARFHTLVSFRQASFYEEIQFGNAEFSNIDLFGIEMKENAKFINYETANFKQVNNRITGLYLKQNALKMNDSVNVMRFKQLEMNAYRRFLIFELSENRLIKNKIDVLLDLFILSFNKCSNSHGNNFIRGVLFTFTSWFIFFSWFMMMRDGFGSVFIWTDKNSLREALNYLWVFNGIDEITKEDFLTWGKIIPFFLGKILIAYGIYQTIAAFRKFNT